MDKISVIMGVYNANKKDYIEKAIGSIIQQSYTEWEFIICDDGSTDGTYEILEKLKKCDDRIILIRNLSNKGLAFSLNRCLELCTGKYIARMDIDDYSEKNRFEKQIMELKNRPECQFCCTNAFLFNDDGAWGIRKMKEKVSNQDFLFTSPFIHATLLADKCIFNNIKYSDKRASRRAEDYELFMNAYAKEMLGFNIQENLYWIREDADCYSRRKYRERWFEAYIRLVGFKKLNLYPRGIPYVLKPLIVGLIPQILLRKVRKDTLFIK